ncbi:MAG: hypothetical protein QM760_21565 [Nibricoccus sp.]
MTSFLRSKTAGMLLGLTLACANLCPGQMLTPSTATSSTTPPAGTSEEKDPDGWPRTVNHEGTTYVIYQPQLDSWDGMVLNARSAVAVQPDSAKEPVYGVIDFSAETETDREQRIVHFEKITLTKANFPSEPEKADAHLKAFQSLVPKVIPDITLDRLEASLAILNAGKDGKSQSLKNDAPRIIFAHKPTMLILTGGAPEWRPVDGTKVERVLNVRVLLLRDKKNVHYLHIYDGYLTAPSLDGPWKIAEKVPGDIKKAEKKLVEAKQVDLLAGQANPETQKTPSLRTNDPPEIIIAPPPAELIVTTGEPVWKPIESTQLLFVENTTSNVFKDLTDQKTYLLISGRWFKGDALAGPWSYVAGAELPKDFAAIPDESPKENVKASVPGTRQAQEAVIANSISQTSRLDRKKAVLNPAPTYEGGPKLAAIDGTPLFFVTNSATPVIKVDEKTWYACYNGAWFSATSADGPWVLATSVPAVIYSIPTSSPLYYVTYVRVYKFDANYVWVGYTPGYYGTVVSTDGVVVYGTGYTYPAYVGTTVYVSYPVTYGYSSTMTWTPWTGWCFGFAVGWAWGASWNYWACCPPAPYWGPYWGYSYGWGYNSMGGVTAWGPYGWASTSGNIYHQNGPWKGVSRVSGGYNAWTGNRWASQYGHAYNSTTGTRAAGQRGAVANVYSGNYAYGARGVATNDRTGNAAWGSKVTAGNAYTGNEVTARRGGYYNENTGETTRYKSVRGEDGGVARIGDDVYAGHDGNIYKKGDDGGWEQLNRGGNSASTLPSENRPSAGTHDARDFERPSTGSGGTGSYGGGSFDRSSLNSEYSARQQGAQRSQSFQSSRGAFHGGGGGGGRRR